MRFKPVQDLKSQAVCQNLSAAMFSWKSYPPIASPFADTPHGEKKEEHSSSGEDSTPFEANRGSMEADVGRSLSKENGPNQDPPNKSGSMFNWWEGTVDLDPASNYP